MPLDILEKIDFIRKDIPRSRFLLRMIENYLTGTITVIEKQSPQFPQVSRPMETEEVAVDTTLSSTSQKGVEETRCQ